MSKSTPLQALALGFTPQSSEVRGSLAAQTQKPRIRMTRRPLERRDLAQVAVEEKKLIDALGVAVEVDKLVYEWIGPAR